MGGPHKFAVTDQGAGWDTLLAAGVAVAPSSHGRRARGVADLFGVAYRDGAFRVDDVEPHQLAAAIVLIANASQQWVTEILSDRQQRQERLLQRRVAEQLRRLFPQHEVRQKARLAGESTKAYDFANVVTLPNRLLIVEPVTNHPGAIAAAYLKLSDVHRAHPAYPREVVIEHEDGWASGDLAVLSEASDGIRDIAAGLTGLVEKYAA
ncbi:MAG: hypothetical protein EA405_13375 [Rhodospirillales bacterium]|nr:MAG: hypothetical protein EA405_13375 [Rhodospirillales bacterium]